MHPILAASNGSDLFWELLVNGLVMGSLFALIALGYSLVYGIIELVNFAHGDLFMLGAALTYTLTALAVSSFGAINPSGKSLVVIVCLLLVVPLFCGVVNIIIDRAVYRPLRRAPRLVPLVSALGVSFVLVNIGQLWIGTSPLSLENKAQLVSDSTLLHLGSIPLKSKDAVVLFTVVPVMAGLTWLVKFTRAGQGDAGDGAKPRGRPIDGNQR